MEKGKPSKTSEAVAIYRAIHQLVDDQPLVFFDPIAPRIIDRTSEFYVRLFTERGQQMARARRGAFVLRSRYAEDCLKDVVLRGIRQYLILGAGLDTFAYRQPQWACELTIYEVDHPITQQWKYEKLMAAGIPLPSNLQFTPIDFESMSLSEGLRTSSFDFTAPTFCSWLGVMYFLTEQTIDATLKLIRGLPPASEIVFNYWVASEALASSEAETSRLFLTQVAEMGEPVLSQFTPEQLETKLRRIGFSEVVHFGPDDGHERYFKGRTDGLSADRFSRLIRAIV
jgi:methyltransferase (TIGR00027 family)